MAKIKNPPIHIPLEGVSNEQAALLVDKSLQSITGLETHRIDLSQKQAIISFNDVHVLSKAVHAIRDLGYGIPSIKKTIPVLQMSCASCAVSVESIIASQPGVINAAVNYASASVSVEYLSNMIQEKIMQKAVQSIGYDLLLDNDGNQTTTLEEIQEQSFNALKHKTLGACLLAFPVFIIGMFYMDMPYANEITWGLSTPVILWFGKDFFINAWKQAQHRSANMDTLVALGTGVAYIFSVFNTLFPQFWHSRGLHGHVYFEAAAVIIAFILLGKLLEEKAKGNTSTAIKKLMGLQPKHVTVIQAHGAQVLKPIEDVLKGDILLVKPGEQIAVDGIVIEGSSYVNESMLSGEAIPVLKKEHENVFSGTINQKGSFQFRAEKVGSETLLANIIKKIQEAQGSKAPVQKMVDKIASIFVPVIIVIALFTFLTWITFGGDNGFSQGLIALATVLVIACPCALGLATPTAIMVGIGKGASQGILIKDAVSLELSKNITAIVLDKTGTITEGKPIVTDAEWTIQDERLKQVLISIEKQSEHPLAEAVVHHLKHTPSLHLTEFESITGKGVKAKFEGTLYFVGNQTLLLENNCKISSSLLSKAQQWSEESKTVIWFSDEENALALLAIEDQLKATSIEAISNLKSLGIAVYMLTGDNAHTAKAMAQKVGINDYKAEVLPEQKAAFIQALQREGHTVAMVGDGINDSTALAQADVSIAMGKGSDIAMDVAKMTIISSDLNKIPLAIKLSKQTVATIHQNLFWAFIYNIIGVPIAAGVLYPFTGFTIDPMLAGGAMALSSVSVVLNSLRLKWKN